MSFVKDLFFTVSIKVGYNTLLQIYDPESQISGSTTIPGCRENLETWTK